MCVSRGCGHNKATFKQSYTIKKHNCAANPLAITFCSSLVLIISMCFCYFATKFQKQTHVLQHLRFPLSALSIQLLIFGSHIISKLKAYQIPASWRQYFLTKEKPVRDSFI